MLYIYNYIGYDGDESVGDVAEEDKDLLYRTANYLIN